MVPVSVDLTTTEGGGESLLFFCVCTRLVPTSSGLSGRKDWQTTRRRTRTLYSGSELGTQICQPQHEKKIKKIMAGVGGEHMFD